MKDEYGEIIELIIPMYEDKIRTIDLEASSGEVIRCKDCRFKECEGRDGLIVCDITGESHQPEWFCADGERGRSES